MIKVSSLNNRLSDLETVANDVEKLLVEKHDEYLEIRSNRKVIDAQIQVLDVKIAECDRLLKANAPSSSLLISNGRSHLPAGLGKIRTDLYESSEDDEISSWGETPRATPR